ncbi:MAG: DUF2270 domain-containing protein [Herpetosiphon sp.]
MAAQKRTTVSIQTLPSVAEHELPAPSMPASRPLTPGEFNTALVHLYRGEVSRSNTWRTRLDGTTNWAVLTTGATLSFAFSSPNNTHVMILINSLLICFFLLIEARRYRYYDLWRARVRLMETEFFSGLLIPQREQMDGEHWRKLLADDLLQPHFNMTMTEAVGRRLRRNYSWIFLVLVLSWNIKVIVHPFASTDPAELLRRATIGPIPGWLVVATGIVFNGLLVMLAIGSATHFGFLSKGSEILTRGQARSMVGQGGVTSAEDMP